MLLFDGGIPLGKELCTAGPEMGRKRERELGRIMTEAEM